jgi:hypothetical protein
MIFDRQRPPVAEYICIAVLIAVLIAVATMAPLAVLAASMP